MALRTSGRNNAVVHEGGVVVAVVDVEATDASAAKSHP
jgi:hypothetical protein